MSKQKHLLVKRLAEKYFFEGCDLTAAQRTIISESKYSGVLDDEPGKFDNTLKKLLESYTSTGAPHERLHTPWVNKEAMSDLVDAVDIRFDLSAASEYRPDMFNSVDLNDLKNFIIKYTKENISDESTKEYVAKLIGSGDAKEIIRKLYLYY